MFFSALAQPVELLLDLGRMLMRTDQSKDIEILLLRRQLPILQRTHARPPRLTRGEKLALAVLAARLRRLCGGARARLDACLLLFKPDNVLRWHRDLVRRKWTFRCQARRGRPPTSPEVVELILRLARENPKWGYLAGCTAHPHRRLGHPAVPQFGVAHPGRRPALPVPDPRSGREFPAGFDAVFRSEGVEIVRTVLPRAQVTIRSG